MVQKQAIGLIIVLLGLLFVPAGNTREKTDAPQAFATWNVFEADKCASIWLIKRHISPNASIRFYDRDESPPEGILFDTPEAEYRRYHNKSTFETLLQGYALNDTTLIYIGRIIHDIEVNIWERKVMDETQKVAAEVLKIMDDKQPEKTVLACLAYFDALYDELH